MKWIIGIIIFVIVYSWLKSKKQKKNINDLYKKSAYEKFSKLVQMINYEAYKGEGMLFFINDRTFNLYKDGENQIITFEYNLKRLTITWKYLYFRKETVLTKVYDDPINLSPYNDTTLNPLEQEKIANEIILAMREKIAIHKSRVLGNSNFY